MRMLATITIQPHVKNKISPEKLLPFPWEEAMQGNTKKLKPLSAAENLKRFEELINRRTS
jgi:hypothetical protein